MPILVCFCFIAVTNVYPDMVVVFKGTLSRYMLFKNSFTVKMKAFVSQILQSAIDGLNFP